MIVVLDANIRLRLTEPTHAQYPVAAAALAELKNQGFSLRTFPQTIYEFWVVSTRPVANNGLGLSPVGCDQEITGFLATFPLLKDKPDLFAEWRSLVTTYACIGKVAHDARIVAAMRTHAISHLLTFNVADFTRYPGLKVLDPNAVAAAATP